MHILYGQREYNYNPDDDATNYLQVSYTRSRTPYVLRIEIPNYDIYCSTLLDAIIDVDVLTDKKAFIGTADPKGLYVEIGLDYTEFEEIRFYNDVDTLTGITLHTTGSGQVQYLYNHLGFASNLSTNTGITLSTLWEGQYLKCPFIGAFRLPLNVNTGVARGGSTIYSQVSSDYEIVTTRLDGGTDITPLNVYNSFTYLIRGKKIQVVYYPFSKLYAVNNFLEYISEDECSIQINTDLKNILFGSTATGNTVKIDTSESGEASIKEVQENLTVFDLVLYHSSSFRGI